MLFYGLLGVNPKGHEHCFCSYLAQAFFATIWSSSPSLLPMEAKNLLNLKTILLLSVSNCFFLMYMRSSDVFFIFVVAVVSALKGLQEKIRKLELERAEAEDNLKRLATESRHYKNVLQKERSVREASEGVISRQNQRMFRMRLFPLCNFVTPVFLINL